MAGKHLKVFQAHLGFYDTVVAAPSQKAALAAWGTRSSEFAKGFAKVTSDPEAVANALAHPGEVLKRPFGSKGAYKLDAEPFPASKLSRRRASAVAARQRKQLDTAARKAVELELRRAREEEKRAFKELESRERELAEKKKAAGDAAK